MDRNEARSAAKSIYLMAASMAGLGATPQSPEQLAELVDQGFSKVDEARRPEAVANMLRIVASALEIAQHHGDRTLHENHVPEASQKVCPVYPFD